MPLETMELTVAEKRKLTRGVSMEDDKPTPVMFDHCMAVYNKMLEEAKETDEGMVYEGHLTKLIASLGMPGPYYSAIRTHLKSMGSIEQIRRGGGNSLSRWRLNAKPNEVSFNSVLEMNHAKNSRLAIVEQQLRDMNKRLTQLENAR